VARDDLPAAIESQRKRQAGGRIAQRLQQLNALLSSNEHRISDFVGAGEVLYGIVSSMK